MQQKENAQWLEIECQLDEILLKVSSGIPEEQIMKNIGVEPRVWMSYKIRHLDRVSALFPNLGLPPYGTPIEHKRMIGAHAAGYHRSGVVLAP